jgi:hypothetical protein
LKGELEHLRQEAELEKAKSAIETQTLREAAAQEAQRAAQEAAARALEAEVARVKAEADSSLSTELERIRVEAEQSRRAQEQAQRQADHQRDVAAQEARKAAHEAAHAPSRARSPASAKKRRPVFAASSIDFGRKRPKRVSRRHRPSSKPRPCASWLRRKRAWRPRKPRPTSSGKKCNACARKPMPG